VNSVLPEKLRKAASSVELAARYNSALGRWADLLGIDRRVGTFFSYGFLSGNSEPDPKDLFSRVRSASKVGLEPLIEDCLLFADAACRTYQMIALVKRIAEIGSSIDSFGIIFILAGLGLLISLLFGFDLALSALFDWWA
jgi:hypothetical protein